MTELKSCYTILNRCFRGNHICRITYCKDNSTPNNDWRRRFVSERFAVGNCLFCRQITKFPSFFPLDRPPGRLPRLSSATVCVKGRVYLYTFLAYNDILARNNNNYRNPIRTVRQILYITIRKLAQRHVQGWWRRRRRRRRYGRETAERGRGGNRLKTYHGRSYNIVSRGK